MALRKGHGTGKGVPRIEVLPIDELPAPVPAPPDPIKRRPDGTFADSESAKAAGQRGGFARRVRTRLVASLGLRDLPEGAAFRQYQVAAEDFMKVQLEELAQQCGGYVGPGPSSMVSSAAIQLAMSRCLFDLGALALDPKLMHQSSVLANDSRQNLLAAYEMGNKEAQARRASAAPADPLAAWMLPEDTSHQSDSKSGGSRQRASSEEVPAAVPVVEEDVLGVSVDQEAAISP